MKRVIFILIIGFFLGSLSGIFGQVPNENCVNKLNKSFILDGQEHIVILKKNKTAKLNTVFYPRFNYRLVVCCNKKINIEVKIFDNNSKEIFSNVNKNYIREWDFQFTSILNGIIELKLAGTESTEESISLLIGYQSIEPK